MRRVSIGDRGSVYEGCSDDFCIFSFLSILDTLSLVHWSCDHLTYIVLICGLNIYIYIYIDVCYFTYLSMCYFVSLFIHMVLIYCV